MCCHLSDDLPQNETYFEPTNLLKLENYTLFELQSLYKNTNLVLHDLVYKEKCDIDSETYKEQWRLKTTIAIEIANRLTST